MAASLVGAGHVIEASDIHAAAKRVQKFVHATPIVTCVKFDEWASNGAASPACRRAFFKCENFQKSGSFKARGASNAVMSLDDTAAAKGVCTHSSGNHAQALAVAAKQRGIPAYIVMPRNAPTIKKDAVKEYGGIVIECEPTQAAREAAATKVAEETGARFVHPSEDPLVIAGQGTMALELLAQIRELVSSAGGSDDGPVVDAIIVPIGGGGMTCGIAVAAHSIDPRIRIIAAEPAEANDASLSKAAGKLEGHSTPPTTIADGLKTTLGTLFMRTGKYQPHGIRHDQMHAAGPHTWPIVRDRVERVICVSEAEIKSAMKAVYERMKLVIEPSAAVGVAVLLSAEFKSLPGIRRVGVVLCGGNVDLATLPF
jgi:threonine dehydratase